jgi:hypothetical protein
MGSGTWTLQGGNNQTVWDVGTSTGLTLNSQTSTIVIGGTAGSITQTFAGGGLTYYNLVYGASTFNNNILVITGANTFNNFSSTKTSANTITFPASTTTTFTNFSLNGTAIGKLSIISSTTGTQATLSQSSGTVSASNLNIKDSNATGGATWEALLTNGNIDSGNNTGWIFTSGSGNYFLLF